MQKKKIKQILAVILVIGLVLGSISLINARAALKDNSYNVPDSNGGIALKVMMREGVIHIEAYSHTATTNIRWETVGLSITLDQVDPAGASTLGRTGPAAVNTASGKGIATIIFTGNEKGEDIVTGDTTMTPYTISASRITNAFSASFNMADITEDTTLYLHGIFRTYQYVNGNKVTRSANLQNWTQIMNAEAWGSGTLDDFKKYYNMYIQFAPEPQKNDLYCITEDNIQLAHHALEDKKPGEMVEWSGEEEEKHKSEGNKDYDLIGCYVTNKESTALKKEEKYIDSGASMDEITSGSTKVEMGGMNVYLIYRERTGEEDEHPTPTPKISSKPTPTVKPSATPTPSIPPVVVPTAAPAKELPLDSPSPYGVINGDKYDAPYFTSQKGISTTESQYVYVKTKDYLLGYRLVNKTGKVTYTVPVNITYVLNYYSATPEEFGGPKPVTDTVESVQYVAVERAYSYWEIAELSYYCVNTAKINNYSLPGGSVFLSLDHHFIKFPVLATDHSTTLTDHVIAPREVTEGIPITRTFSSEDDNRPLIEPEDFSYYALTQTGQATVKNDYVYFDNQVILSDSPAVKIAPRPNVSGFTHSTAIIQDKALYTEGQVIEAEKNNGVYLSNGIVNYTMHPACVYAVVPTRTYPVAVNDVTIHTPVICVPVVTADNDKWTQLISPTEDAVQIVLDPDNTLNDFNLSISNTLFHSNRPGYLSRDFSRSFIDPEYTSYLARADGIVRNEVKFPFDVYQDTFQDKNKENDKYIRAGTWIVLGRDTFRFYVPMWVQEGVYTAELRSVAVNVGDRIKNSEETKNANINSYVATATVNFEVSGRIYGLQLYDISDYPKWQEVFRKDKSMRFKLFEGVEDGTKKSNYSKDYGYYYSMGTKDQYGKDTGRYSKYTLPLVNGSHPKYTNLGVLKTGYAVRFRLDTVGEMYGGFSKIRIMPTFYYVDADGKNRRQVDLYYSESIYHEQRDLVKVGAGIDLVNLKQGKTGNLYSRIPESELRHTADVLNTTYDKLYHHYDVMYAYSKFYLGQAFRTFIGTDYASEITGLNSFPEVEKATGQTTLSLSKYMQRWYGTYKIPQDVHIVKAGYDVYGYLEKYGIDYQEDFWLKGGYLIVNFNIITLDSDGKERLSYLNGDNYLNNGNCSMCITEGAVIQKTDNKGAVFNFKAGDFIIYYSDKSYSDDYEGRVY